jgi:hypothetical protein
VESYATPAWAEEYLTRLGGLNPYGEPNFRAIWSENRLDWICGKWTDTDESGEIVLREVIEARFVPKYWVIKDRWLIEQWYPQTLSLEEWNRITRPPDDYFAEGNMLQLGPYCPNGQYRLACVVQDSRQNFIQLTMDVVTEFFWKREKQRREQLSLAAAVQADKDAHAAVEAAKDAKDMELLNSLAPEYGSSAVFQTR